MKLHIVYNHDAVAVSDAKALDFAKAKLKRVKGTEQELQVNTSTENVINAFQLLVKLGEIDKNDILFYFIDTKFSIRIDKNGTLEEYPIGFMDQSSNILLKLL